MENKHMIIMPTDCYKATSGHYKGQVVRKSSWGVETKATWDEVRYIVSDFSEAAIEQAFQHHTCDCVMTNTDLPFTFEWIPKKNKQYKIEVYE